MTPEALPGGSKGSSRPIYPAGDVVLRDGSTVRVRVMRSDDEKKLLALFQSLSEEARWSRFFSIIRGSALAAEAHREVTLDNSFALVASSGPEVVRKNAWWDTRFTQNSTRLALR
jgi:hypothetical protein